MPEWSTSQYWQGRFLEGDTPWELHAPSGVLMEALYALEGTGFTVAGKRILCPGCGRGADAFELVRRGGQVVAVDWSEEAINALRERYESARNSLVGTLELIQGDLFESSLEMIDLVCEHTLFCAIDPAARLRYVELMTGCIRPGGYLVGNFFIVGDEEVAQLKDLSLAREGRGPPFATTVTELKGLLEPYFIERALRPGSNSAPNRRQGIEWVGLFERRAPGLVTPT